MDTIKILLIATVALLLGFLVVDFFKARNAPKYASADEVARLHLQLDEIRMEQAEKELQTHKQAKPAEAPKDESGVAALKAKVDEQEAALKALADEKQKAERDAKVAKEEAGVIAQRDLESHDQTARRARLISQALLIARVKEYMEDPNVGNFATLEVLMPGNLKAGDILAIRRNTGILGKFKVSEVNAEGAIANPLQAFPTTKPQAGDELIVPPQD